MECSIDENEEIIFSSSDFLVFYFVKYYDNYACLFLSFIFLEFVFSPFYFNGVSTFSDEDVFLGSSKKNNSCSVMQLFVCVVLSEKWDS